MTKLTASQDISQFLASANKTEAVGVLEAIKTENLLASTLIVQSNDTVKAYLGNIGSSAFYNQGTLKGLSLGYSVASIGAYAFQICTGLTGPLNIPNSVTSIGNAAFENCVGFNGSLTIGNSVTTIADDVFSNCAGFTGSLVIPNSVTSIGSYAFNNCSNISRININRAVAPTISANTFLNMTGVSPAVVHVPVGASGYATGYNGLTIVKDL